jgi:hypothetical protein
VLLAGDALDDREPALSRIPQPRSGRHSAQHLAPEVVEPARAARPPIGVDPDILGLSRISRGRVGSRVFSLFFVLVFVVIFVQMVFALLMP